jgi:hypothetical protein
MLMTRHVMAIISACPLISNQTQGEVLCNYNKVARQLDELLVVCSVRCCSWFHAIDRARERGCYAKRSGIDLKRGVM